MVLGKLDNHMQKNKIGCLLFPLTKLNPKWIRFLNVGPEIIKLLEENIGGKLLNISFGSDFFLI